MQYFYAYLCICDRIKWDAQQICLIIRDNKILTRIATYLLFIPRSERPVIRRFIVFSYPSGGLAGTDIILFEIKTHSTRNRFLINQIFAVIVI